MPQDIIPYDAIPVPTASPISLVLGALKDARPIVCSAYRAAPGFFTAEADTSLPGVQQFHAKSAMDAYCGPDPGGLPTPPQGALPNGNCPGTIYVAFATSKYLKDTRGPDGGASWRVGAPALVSVTGSEDISGPAGELLRRTHYNIYDSNHNVVGDAPVDAYRTGDAIALTVSPVDGGPDNCGGKFAPGYGYSNPGPSITNNNVNINDPNGPVINAPVTIHGNISGSPRIDVGGFRFSFSAGGVHVDVAPNPPDPTKPASPTNPVPPPTPDSSGGSPVGSGPGDRQPPNADTHNINPQPSKPGDKKTNLPHLAYVQMDLDTYPVNRQIDRGQTPPDVVLRSGWFWFTIGEYHCRREFLDTYSKIFVAPSGADGYVFSLKPGFTAHATEYTPKST